MGQPNVSAFRLRAQAYSQKHQSAISQLASVLQAASHAAVSSARICQVVARRRAKQTRISVLRSTGASAEQSRGRSAPVYMAVMGRGLSHALGDQPMSMSIDDIGFSERG